MHKVCSVRLFRLGKRILRLDRFPVFYENSVASPGRIPEIIPFRLHSYLLFFLFTICSDAVLTV